MTAPRFSIVTPVYDTPPDVLRRTLESVRRQTFTDWELCLVDDASPSPHVGKILDKAARNKRIRWTRRAENGGIVAASNDALAMAQGEFVVLLDHDDELHVDALQLAHQALAAQPEADYLYTDEDKIDEAGNHFAPFFKPGWSPERFRTQMYTCHMSVLRRSLVEEVGGFHEGFEGSQDWDLVLRVTEKARQVVHVPQVLYHWRMLATSTAGAGVAAKPYAYQAGTRAIQAHCDRVGFPAVAEHNEESPGIYHLRPRLTDQPLVSIIIPTAGTPREVWGENIILVTHCVRSIVDRSTYDNYEIVCVVDTGTDPSVVEELTSIAGDKLRVVMYDQPFNFSDKINTGAVSSRGEHLLLLNDDMEIITPDWIERLVMYSSFEGVGAVGAKLLYSDGRIQHAGVTVRNVRPGHIIRGYHSSYGGYFSFARVANNYMAVTGACLMSSREAFESVGGLCTDLPVNFNDIDYCLKLRSQGMRVVYDPDTVLYHFESSSRSPKVAEWELELLTGRWRALATVDPYDNPNMDRHTIDMVPPVYLTTGQVV